MWYVGTNLMNLKNNACEKPFFFDEVLFAILPFNIFFFVSHNATDHPFTKFKS